MDRDELAEKIIFNLGRQLGNTNKIINYIEKLETDERGYDDKNGKI